MPYGTPPEGSAAIFYVGATSTPTIPLGGLFNWDDSEDSPSKDRKYYMQPAITSVGIALKTLTAQCDYEAGDSGQQLVFAARKAKTAFFIATSPGGVNGEVVQVKVTNQKVSGPDPEGFSTVNWTFGQQSAPTDMGAGYGG